MEKKQRNVREGTELRQSRSCKISKRADADPALNSGQGQAEEVVYAQANHQ